MGFFNWLLKNGPGSPGSTTKAFLKMYQEHEVVNHNKDWESVFQSLFMIRFLSFQRLGFAGGCLLHQVEMNDIIEQSEGDLAVFIFQMMSYETLNFRANANNTFIEVTEVIYEIIKKEKPNALMFDISVMRNKSMKILNSINY